MHVHFAKNSIDLWHPTSNFGSRSGDIRLMLEETSYETTLSFMIPIGKLIFPGIRLTLRVHPDDRRRSNDQWALILQGKWEASQNRYFVCTARKNRVPQGPGWEIGAHWLVCLRPGFASSSTNNWARARVNHWVSHPQKHLSVFACFSGSTRCTLGGFWQLLHYIFKLVISCALLFDGLIKVSAWNRALWLPKSNASGGWGVFIERVPIICGAHAGLKT